MYSSSFFNVCVYGALGHFLGGGPGAVVKAASFRDRGLEPLHWPSSFKEPKCFFQYTRKDSILWGAP